MTDIPRDKAPGVIFTLYHRWNPVPAKTSRGAISRADERDTSHHPPLPSWWELRYRSGVIVGNMRHPKGASSGVKERHLCNWLEENQLHWFWQARGSISGADETTRDVFSSHGSHAAHWVNLRRQVTSLRASPFTRKEVTQTCFGATNKWHRGAISDCLWQTWQPRVSH